jgi:hypothetical protein
LRKEWISAESINQLFAKYKVGKTFDLLSIDIDGNDYWVWEAIDESQFRARIVVIEVRHSVQQTAHLSLLPGECKHTDI